MGAVEKLQRAVLSHRMVTDIPSDFAGVDLRAELLAHGIDHRACLRLIEAGVEGRFVAELSAGIAIGVARVCLSRDGSRWEPEGPDGRLLLACFDGGHLIDIAAVWTSHPDQVALRSGDGWCLGEDRLCDAERYSLAGRHVRLRVFSDPMEWLRGRGEGICVLDWGAALPRLRGLGERVTLECDAVLAMRVREMLQRGGLPQVATSAPDGAALRAAHRVAQEQEALA